MADRIFKGKLVAERSLAFPESSEDFNKPHAGGLVPFELFEKVISAESVATKMVQGVLWISAGDAWVRIEQDGNIEIGISGV